MKIFYIDNFNNVFFDELKDIKLNNSIKDRILIYQHLKKKFINNIKDFYLFYDKYNILNCFIEFKNFELIDFKKIEINDNFLQQQINQYLLYKKSKILVKNYHSNQIYGGFMPYFFHLYKVDKVIDYFFYDIPSEKIFTTKIGALLHDIIEDTDYTLCDLEKDFGNEIKNIVFNVTKIDEKKTKDYEIAYYEKVASNLLSSFIKIADKIVNAKQTLKDKNIKHIYGMTNGHKIFQDCIYNKICKADDIKKYLDLLMVKMEVLKLYGGL